MVETERVLTVVLTSCVGLDASHCLCCLAENYVCNDSLVMDGLASSANLFTFKSIIFIHSVIQYWCMYCLEASFVNG